ncbi:MAG TPA: hypothetical protein VL354_08035 [Spirochaetia bacterium]|nr:hypothetical protein [Spirochaetia bacterium]
MAPGRGIEMQSKSERLESWKEKNSEFLKSGMTRKAFCEKNGIKKSALDYWFTRIRRLERGQELVEIRPRSAGTSGCIMAVSFGRYRIELSDLAAVQILAQAVKALESVG